MTRFWVRSSDGDEVRVEVSFDVPIREGQKVVLDYIRITGKNDFQPFQMYVADTKEIFPLMTRQELGSQAGLFKLTGLTIFGTLLIAGVGHYVLGDSNIMAYILAGGFLSGRLIYRALVGFRIKRATDVFLERATNHIL
ncbi:hypothetical protein AB6D11_19125 [Vibrio splendidus]